jgi:hypothetical protein
MKVQAKGKTECQRFNNLLRSLLAVPHSEIRAKLDAEKRAKERKKRNRLKASASGRA